jgi:ketosteroid isomerase-like protein
MASDEQQIRHLMEKWRRRASAGDVEGLLALTADQAVLQLARAAKLIPAVDNPDRL